MASTGNSKGQYQLNARSIPVSSQAFQAAQNDGRSSVVPLRFPATRTALWDPRSIGPPLILHIANFRNLTLSLEEKTLYFVHHFAEKSDGDNYTCTLSGSLNVYPDGEGVNVTVDQFDTSRPPSPTEALPDNVVIPCQIRKENAKPSCSIDDFTNCIESLYQRCGSRQRVDLTQFIALRSYCSYYGNHQSFIFNINFDLVTPATMFKLTPVNSIPIAPTALSKNLCGPLSVAEVQGEPKSGYLSMDDTRKLLLVLESDPKVNHLPLVGIWISGVTSVQDPFVWASCLRYLQNNNLKDRVCKPPEQFLVVLFSLLQSRPVFFQANTSNGRSNLDFTLYTCHEVIKLPKDSAGGAFNGGMGIPLELEMVKVESGDKQMIFQAALEKSESLLSSPVRTPQVHSSTLADAHDIMPRSVPTPHMGKVASIIKPSVPDVSLLMDELPLTPRNGANPTSQMPTLQQQYRPQSQLSPQLAPVPKTKKPKKHKDVGMKNPSQPPSAMYMAPQLPYSPQLPAYMQSAPMMPQHPYAPMPTMSPGFQQYGPHAHNAVPYFSPGYHQQFQSPHSQMPPPPSPLCQYSQEQYQPPQFSDEQQPPQQQQHQQYPAPQQVRKSSSRTSLSKQEGIVSKSKTSNNSSNNRTPQQAAHVRNQTPQGTRLPISPQTSMSGSPQVAGTNGGHDSGDSGLHDSSGEPQDDPAAAVNASPQIPAHVLDKMKWQEEQIEKLMQQVSLLQQQQQQQQAPAVNRLQQDSATQSSNPSSPMKKLSNSVGINTSLLYPQQEISPEREREGIPQECTMSFSDYPPMNVHQQDTTTSVVSDIMPDMPDYESMSPDKCNMTNSDAQSPVFESASMCGNQNVSEQYQEGYVESRQHCEAQDEEEYHEVFDENAGPNHTDELEETNPVMRNQGEFYENIMAAMAQMLQPGGGGNPNDSMKSDPGPLGYHNHIVQHNQSHHSLRKSAEIDVAQRTREQIAKYTAGLVSEDSEHISVDSSTRYDQTCYIDPNLVQRIEYQSMVLDPEFSMYPTDALAMKYLSDDQLSALAKLRLASPHKAAGVDTLLAASSTPPTPNKNMSMASKAYLRRYGLLNSDEMNSQVMHPQSNHSESYGNDGTLFSDASSGNKRPVRRSLGASLTEQKSDRVLDIEELRELPKLF